MTYDESNGLVTVDVTWPRNVKVRAQCRENSWRCYL